MNEELLERLAKKRGSAHRAPSSSAHLSASLNYQSPPAEVQAWFVAKGFSQQLSTRYQQNSAHKKNQFHVAVIVCLMWLVKSARIMVIASIITKLLEGTRIKGDTFFCFCFGPPPPIKKAQEQQSDIQTSSRLTLLYCNM